MQIFSTPILLLVFNRPDYLQKTIAILRALRPTQLYISGDGPRQDNREDKAANQAIRDLLRRIDWQCDIHTHFNQKNLGCKLGVSSGITWFFEKVESGIILEDDCMPDNSFFFYCAQLLDKYKDDSKVGMIGGSTFFDTSIQDSYWFSIHPHCWGWATWRRAWNKYDVRLKDLEDHGEKVISSKFKAKKTRDYWMKIFQKTRDGQIDTWDYQWIYTCWRYDMLCVVPAKNLITNIGFDSRATHTKSALSPIAFQKQSSLTFPLKHPKTIEPNHNLDSKIQTMIFEKNLVSKLALGARNYLSRLLFPDVRMKMNL